MLEFVELLEFVEFLELVEFAERDGDSWRLVEIHWNSLRLVERSRLRRGPGRRPL